MTPRLLALVAAVGLVACESTFPQDLETFCKVVGDVDKTPSITAAEKLTRIDARRGEYARYGLLETRDVWAEAASQQGQDKYRYLLAAGRNLGAREWRCPGYATLLNVAEVEALGAAPAPSDGAETAAAGRATADEPVTASAVSRPRTSGQDTAAETPKVKKKGKSRRGHGKKSRSPRGNAVSMGS